MPTARTPIPIVRPARPAPHRGSPFGTAGKVLFWLAFYGLGTLVLLLTWRAFGRASPVAVLLQSAAAVWALTLALHLLGRKAAYASAAAWVLMLGLPLAFQIVRRAHHWATIGMEAPDGMGSPMAFLLGFIVEWLVFAPLCFMLAVLAFLRPWRADRRRGATAAGPPPSLPVPDRSGIDR